MNFRFLAILSMTMLLSSCWDTTPPPQNVDIDPYKAREVADAVAQDLLKDDAKDLYVRLDAGFGLMVNGIPDVEKVIQKIDDQYGKPQDFKYKIIQGGTRTDGQIVRPKRVFWYQAFTAKHPKGDYYLKVEVVPARDLRSLDVSGFGLLTFKNQVPELLR
jgi:hypothetical protein